MSQQFVINLHNPDISSPPDDIIYTGLAGGNKLKLMITNNSGFGLSFPSGLGKPDLLVKIAKAIIDDAGAAAITVQAPWQTDGIYTPDNDPDPSDQKNYYVVKLKMAASSPLSFPNDGTITVELENIKPTEKGSATIIAYYDFGSGLTMNTTGQISVLGSSTSGKQLIGDTAYLKYTLMVNDGDDVNPIVATDPGQCVTSSNAAENKIHLNFFFLNPDSNSDPGGTMGGLVPGWDTNHPPTFKVRFPYFDGNSPDPAAADLTDDFAQGDPSYNEYTSAWNIKLSLDSQNPNTLTNTWWTIIPPVTGSASPFWLIQPTLANKYLFTGLYTGPDASGPFLDLYFSHIYSNLPISSNNPETQIILETYDFTGFNDASSPRPLFKVQSVQILCFSGEVSITPAAGSNLVLTWTTKNADHCFIGGDSNQLGPSSYGTSYSKIISNSSPLKSSYTLTAFDKQGVSKISKTIFVQWMADDNNVFPVSASFIAPTAMDIYFGPTGSTVYVAGAIQDPTGTGPVCVSILNGQTLVATPNPIILPNNEIPLNVKASSDGTKILIAGLTVTGDTGKIYGFNTATPPQNLQGSPFSAVPCSWPNSYPMAHSGDNSQLIISNPFPFGSQTPVKPFIEGINTTGFIISPSTGNPFSFTVNNLGPIGLKIRGNNIFFPVVDGSAPGGLGVMNRTTLTPVTGSPVSLRSDSTGIKYTPGPLIVSGDGKTVTTLAQGYDTQNNWSRVFILCQVDIISMKLTKRVQVFNGYQNTAMTPTTDLAYSVDEKYIFVFGLKYDASGITDNQTLVSVFDVGTLQELTWSPVAVPLGPDKTKTLIEQIIISPDGSRIYALARDSSTASKGSVRSFIPYFPDPPCTFAESEINNPGKLSFFDVLRKKITGFFKWIGGK